MNKKLITPVVSMALVALMALPFIASAAAIDPIAQPNVRSDADVWEILGAALTLIWPIMAGAAIIMFVIAAFLFLTSSGDPTKVAAARASIIWSVVGLAIAIISFSIPYIIRNTLSNAGF